MEGIIDHGLAFGALVVILHRRLERLALLLGRKRQHRGGTATGGGQGAGGEIIRHLHPRRHRLVQMAVRIHPARQHQLARCIYLLPAACQALAQRHDAAILHGDIALGYIRRGRHPTVANDQIIIGHTCTPLLSPRVLRPQHVPH